MSKKDFNEKNVVLSIENLKKYFVSQGYINKAVDDVSFEVHKGEIVGLIGESGSGKTTVGRTILRLYDECNGFVRLNGKIISGKRISNKRRKFLRKNVQMIFQDPHASLNGQQNIYSILKEPLKINGIMKERIDDIFKDWSQVKSNFKYTFHIEAMKLQLSNLKEINKLAKPFFYKWTKKFDHLEFDEKLSNEDNFNLFFSYLDEKQHIESLIIDNMYSNTNSLLSFYYDCQKRYREHNITPFEDAYLLNVANLKRAQNYVKYTKAGVLAREEIKRLKLELKRQKRIYNDLLNSTRNAFLNFNVEFKNEAELANIARLSSTDLSFYLYNLKNELIFKKQKSIWNTIKPHCKLLEFETLKALINGLKKASQDFYKKYLEAIPYQNNLKQILQQKIDKFQFDATEYIEKSKQLEKEFQAIFTDLNEKIRQQKLIIKNTVVEEDAQKHLDEVKLKLKEVQEVYEKERISFIASYKIKIKELYEQIKEEDKLYHELVDLQTKCNKQLDEVIEKYWKYLESQIKDKETEKDIRSLIAIYKSDLAIKLDTLKSFTVEKHYLNKDISKIYLLLGVDIRWVEKNIELAAKTGAESSESKWGTRFNLLDTVVLRPVTKILISQLLYKTTIYKALEEVGLLKQFAYRYPHEFSGGQLQRIVIARALITEPQVIVADEPIASLDISIQAQVVNLLKELCRSKEIGLIFIAHDLSMIEYIADNVQIMHLGKIVEHGKTELIYDKPLHPYTINLFKAIPKISNANVKFQDVSFELDYLDAQQFPNVPIMKEVEPNHFIYGTEEQIIEWTKE